MVSLSAHGRELLCEASEAETSGECSCLFLLSLPSSFCVTFLTPLKKNKKKQQSHGRAVETGSRECAAFIPRCVPPPQVDGVSYLLQEIYGIENKYNSQESKVSKARVLLRAETAPSQSKIAALKTLFVVFPFCFRSPGRRRRDQRQQRRVRGVSVGREGHAHPALPTPVSVQRLRRHAALPGQLLPHLQTA